jgi:NitT/TauT family transport system ATP-binding protein
MPENTIVRLDGVGKVFSNGVKAIDSLDLEVREGEFLALLGPSGCGKSTALRLIASLSEPTHGTIRWAGERSSRRKIGFVFRMPR